MSSGRKFIPQPPTPQLIPVVIDQIRLKGARDGGVVKAIEFQYVPLDMQETGWESEWATVTTMNQDQPIQQFSNGKEKGYKFTMKLWAEDSDQDIQETYDLLKRCVVKDNGLSRPARFVFIWGKAIHSTVVVKSLGDPRWDALRSDGSLRGVTMGVVLAIYEPSAYGLTGKPDPHTYYYTTKWGDTWEQIALVEYGDPILGCLLRQDNPRLPHPGSEPGTVIPLPPYQTISKRDIAISSRPLMRTPAGMALRARMFQLRSDPKLSLTIG